ncbi:MAG: protease inhibitor I42 family protein [Candidatus Brocadiaceae bacterium]|nr:protease inhibitor I42 family protein [Candidatus Brocadiaceae bacterium]
MAVVYRKGQQKIFATVGAVFDIELNANPTTGYEWQIHIDKNLVQLINRCYEISDTGIGAGGIERFAFEALKPGKTLIRMESGRAWESKAIEVLKFTLHVSP